MSVEEHIISKDLSCGAEIPKDIHVLSFNLQQIVVKSRWKTVKNKVENYQIKQIFKNVQLCQSNSVLKKSVLGTWFQIIFKTSKRATH